MVTAVGIFFGTIIKRLRLRKHPHPRHPPIQKRNLNLDGSDAVTDSDNDVAWVYSARRMNILCLRILFVYDIT